MPRFIIDPTLQRVQMEGFSFPLGVYPVEPIKPRQGFVVEFESADGGGGEERETPEFPTSSDDAGGATPEPATEDGPVADQPARSPTPGNDWEEWPDRFMFDILVSAERVPALCRLLFSLLPGRVYPILDVMGHDDYREIDPYIAYDLVGIEKFLDAIRAFPEWFFEDGMVGFGAMALDPFLYVFVDEHKVVTVRAGVELKEKIERLLASFALEPIKEVVSPDAAPHEHRTILANPETESEALTADDILDRLREAWLLQLNVDARTNIDEDGSSLGVTGWRCIVRCVNEDETKEDGYAQVLLAADSLETAERLAAEAVADDPQKRKWADVDPLNSDRLTPEHLSELLGQKIPKKLENSIFDVRWLE